MGDLTQMKHEKYGIIAITIYIKVIQKSRGSQFWLGLPFVQEVLIQLHMVI